MDLDQVISFKIYLIQPNVPEIEIRRFGLLEQGLKYHKFLMKLMEMFPKLSGKAFSVYCKDEEGDEVAVSSDEEFQIVLKPMKAELKKFTVKMEGSSTEARRNMVVHPNIFCDGCGSNLRGFRYKCIICSDYDLCDTCERSKGHGEHPMLKIPDPDLFRRSSLEKIIRVAESLASRDRHRARKHCADDAHPDAHHRKHKKCDRHESGDTDDSEEGCRRKHSHSHKKMKKGRCPYNQIMSDVFTYLSPKQFPVKPEETTGEDGTEESSQAKYLRSVGMTLQKFLDPLGVEVDFEVRPNGAKEEQGTEEKKATTGEGEKKATTGEGEKKATTGEGEKKATTGEEEKKATTAEEEKKRSTPEKIVSGQKEVRFVDPQEVTRQVEEIAKLLARQTVNGASSSNNSSSSGSDSNGNGKSADSDDWVEFEELRRENEDPRPNSSSKGAIPKNPQQQEHEKAAAATATAAKEKAQHQNQPLSPDSTLEQPPINLAVRSALEKMLSMGFTNEGNWLGQLLEAKNGNISHALEVLDPCNKHSSHR